MPTLRHGGGSTKWQFSPEYGPNNKAMQLMTRIPTDSRWTYERRAKRAKTYKREHVG